MRRLALSLDGLDRANENLVLRLKEQEAELAELHRAEQLEGAREVRNQERQRLTHDLHDGISGHLVSIIAMSEQSGGDAKPIEQAAREALDDLRLVIYSLDLGDRELPLALANFRERLIPQLRRIAVELDWSTANLPEVSGVTPGNALMILRILQETITNALKHGPATRIAVRGSAAENGMAAIAVENDGRPFMSDKPGFGLDNMRRRARQLRGEIQIDTVEGGVRLTLLLPLHLPDFSDAADSSPRVRRAEQVSPG
jgi:signal transduction histidine kinase